MTDRKRIVGNPGTTAPSQPAVIREPPPQQQRTAALIKEGGQWFARVDNMKVPLDGASANRLQVGAPNPRPRKSDHSGNGELGRAIDAARNNKDRLSRLAGVVSVRAGYKFIDGKITSIPAVVVAVKRKLTDVPAADRIPSVVDGVPTDVTVADPYETLASLSRTGREATPVVSAPPLLIDQIQQDETAAAVEEALPVITYTPPPDGNLDPVTGAMTLTCHVSPDAGWGVLKPFLQGTERKIRLGMYDFTAPHIYQSVRTLLRDSDVSWEQTLSPGEALPSEDDVDSPKAGDLTEDQIVRGLKRVATGGRFANAFAHLGKGGTFASAYHIKVAVRDDSAFWLSSGNWQSSNQPEQDFLEPDADRTQIPKFNREWHVVVENATLAKHFQRFLEHDFDTASAPEDEAALAEAATVPAPDLVVDADEWLEEERAAADLQVFPPQRFVFTQSKPLTLQPILTPDNYLQIVLELLRHRPKQRIYFQNQSLNPVKSPSEEFAEMMSLLAQYSQDKSLDARFIFRNIGPVRKKLESLQLAGFDMRRVRMQAGCHTKGIIIDSATVLLGSHNFTNQGVQVNRDASLLIRDQPAIAQYYERVFLHDWEKLARETLREESTPAVLVPGQEAAEWRPSDSTVRVPWSYYAEE